MGGDSPNAVAGGSTPSCQPVETYAEQAGSPLPVWTWDDLPASKGLVVLKSLRAPRLCMTGTGEEIAQCLAFNPPPGQTTDVLIKVLFKYLRENGTNFPVHGHGTLVLTIRATFDDLANGDMTLNDLVLEFPFDVAGGHADATTSLDVLLNANGIPALPHCSSVEILSLAVLDEHGNTFAVPGVFSL